MRISVQTARLFESFGLDGGYALLHDLGFEAVDFGLSRFLLPADIRNEKGGSIMDGDFDAIMPHLAPYREAALRHHIVCAQTHAPFPSYEWGRETLNTRMAHVLINTIRATAYLGAPYCVVHPAKADKDCCRPSPAEEWEVNHAMYAALIPVLKETGVVCCLENLFSAGEEGTRYASACSDFSEAVQWIDQLNQEAGRALFGFCLDTGHCNLTRQTLRRAVLLLGDRLKVLHIHDNMGHLDQHLAPYMGTIKWDEFLKALHEIGYQGDLNFETFNVLDSFPSELHRVCLQLIAETGWLFRERIEAMQ